MSRPAANKGVIARRVLYRAGALTWHNRYKWLGGGVALVALSALATPGALSLVSPEVAGVQASGTDCADVMMGAIASGNADQGRAAYQCMAGGLSRTIDEGQFVTQLQSRGRLASERITRVGEHRASDGGKIVYYAVDSPRQSVGYTIYLGVDGKILKIE